MNNNTIYIGRIISAMLLGLSTIPFLYIFFFESDWDIEIFILCMIPMAVFGAIFFRFDKQMKSRKNCSKYEYISFYEKCKNSVKAKGFNLSDEDKEAIKQQAKDMDYFLNIEEEILFEIYKKGLKEYRAKNKKAKNK